MPPPFLAAVAQAFRDHLPDKSTKVGVAVSGGGDSMALLALLHDRSTTTSHQIHAATVDHGLRPAARAEAEMVANWCKARHIPHEILTLPPLSETGNLQANARNARYAALAEWALHLAPAMPVLTAHTMDDQAETVLMRLARGSGAEGLSGIGSHRHSHGVQWIRPFLGIRRHALRAWLRQAGVPWIEDPSNEDLRFDRVKARKALDQLAPLGVTVEGLATTADRLRRQSEVLTRDADHLEERALLNDPGQPTAEIDRVQLRNAHPDTGMRFLAETIRRVGGRDYRPRFRALEPLYQRITGTAPVRATLGLCLIEADAAIVIIRPEHP